MSFGFFDECFDEGGLAEVCCRCQRTKLGEIWVELPTAPQRMPSHGYCPDCFQHALRKLKADILSHRFGGRFKNRQV